MQANDSARGLALQGYRIQCWGSSDAQHIPHTIPQLSSEAAEAICRTVQDCQKDLLSSLQTPSTRCVVHTSSLSHFPIEALVSVNMEQSSRLATRGHQTYNRTSIRSGENTEMVKGASGKEGKQGAFSDLDGVSIRRGDVDSRR